MQVYMSQVQRQTPEQLWKQIGGDKKGYMSLEEMLSMFDKNMPKAFCRDLAYEMMREIDSDRDGRITFKDFYECIKFQL